MAEPFLFNILEDVLWKVSSLALEQITLAWNIKSEVNRLENTLSTIKAVILDADEQQYKNNEVRNWLEKLKFAVYDIDDLFDDIHYTRISSTIPYSKGALILNKVSRFFSSSNSIVNRFKIGRRIKDLRQRLDEIADDRRKFHFTEQAHSVIPLEKDVKEQSHSFVRSSDIVGRDDDKELILQLLLSPVEDEHVSVIPIVGIGGLGKTTVVKLVYNDERVMQSFDLGMWVSVSEDFSSSKVVEKILKSATGESLGHLELDQMQTRLTEVLKEKKYLLVLDDVWNEDRNKWMDLKELLVNCKSGSKIIVTTRNKTVANITSTIPPYHLTGLSENDCLSLFLKCAFKSHEDRLPNLVSIGKEIVKKCGGVPLAVKTLGSLLYMNKDEQEWLRIKDNDIWEIDQKQTDILPLLRLSYERLPSHLKQCFANCSMLPKGLEIPREVFIDLWIAQGLVHSRNSNRAIEDIANQYFDELLSRFCFQEVVEAFDGEVLACRIHSLVHELAKSVADGEYLNAKRGTKSLSKKTRHLYFHDSDDLSGETLPNPFLRLKYLRLFRFEFKVNPLSKRSVTAITSSFRRLRVLTLNALELEELPSSIGKLKQLRYLDLSHCTNLKFLPESFCKLVNLQTLNLINCDNLQDLPRKFRNLISLKTLYLTCWDISLGKKVDHGSFSSLRFLLLYNCDFVHLPSEVFERHLTCIKVLRIYECPRLVSLPNSVEHLTSLEKLWIWNCDELDLSESEGVKGLSSLKSLLFMGLPKLINLPSGLMRNFDKSLKFFRIANCANLIELPEWILSFSSLQRLYIEDCPNLVSMPDLLHGFAAEVHVSGCPKLGES